MRNRASNTYADLLEALPPGAAKPADSHRGPMLAIVPGDGDEELLPFRPRRSTSTLEDMFSSDLGAFTPGERKKRVV